MTAPDASPPYGALLRPLTIKGVTIRNRVMSTAHTSGAGDDGKPKERYQRYQEERARGGIGLTIVGGSTAVAPDTPGAAMLHLDASADGIVPWYAELSDRIHRHGATVFAQIAHMGRRANYDNEHWIAPVAPSPVREPAHRAFPRVAEDWDLRRLVRAFAAAARRVRDGGIDGVELSATHGHLLDQFWSPRVNHRTDEYGGSLQNRVRFSLEVIEAVRSAVGDDYVVGLRLSGDELIAGGLTSQDCVEIASMLVDGGVDYLSVLGGQAEDLPSHATIFPGMDARPAPFLGLASQIRAAVDVPVFYAQRVADLGTAARAIESGAIDMVGMTRAHLADPHVVRKLESGRAHEIRPCVGANYCIDRLYKGGQAFCLHNPATGRELTMPHVISRAARPRQVVIVGAGPAGLEAARVCAARGHGVVILERRDRTGGLVDLAARVTWRSPLRDITRWLERRARADGADIRLETEASPDVVLSQRPDVVILATGGVPARPPMAGGEHAVTVVDLLRDPSLREREVIVFDDNGAEPALSAAELLALNGCTVTFVTPDPAPASLLERTTRPSFLRRLYRLGVTFVPDSRVTAVRRTADRIEVRVVNEYSREESVHTTDSLVVEHGTVPDPTLYEQLRERSANGGEIDLVAMAAGAPQPAPDGVGFRLYRVGDCLASRNIHAAIYEALRLCKDL